MLNHVTDIRFMCVQHIIIFIIFFLLLYLSRSPLGKIYEFSSLYEKKKKKKKKPLVK